MGLSCLYHPFLMALVIVASTLLFQCPNASAGMTTMRKLAGSLPWTPPPPYGSRLARPMPRPVWRRRNVKPPPPPGPNVGSTPPSWRNSIRSPPPPGPNIRSPPPGRNVIESPPPPDHS